MIVTYPDHTIRNIPDMIKTAKSRSEPLLCGVPGAGTPQHLLMEYFMRLAGIKIQIVPFRGGNQALTELLGKRLDFLLDPPIALIGQIKSGALHAIGVTGGKRYRAAAGCRHHRRGGLSRLLRHLVDGHVSGRPSCRRKSRRGSTARSTR